MSSEFNITGRIVVSEEEADTVPTIVLWPHGVAAATYPPHDPTMGLDVLGTDSANTEVRAWYLQLIQNNAMGLHGPALFEQTGANVVATAVLPVFVPNVTEGELFGFYDFNASSTCGCGAGRRRLGWRTQEATGGSGRGSRWDGGRGAQDGPHAALRGRGAKLVAGAAGHLGSTAVVLSGLHGMPGCRVGARELLDLKWHEVRVAWRGDAAEAVGWQAGARCRQRRAW